MSLKLEKKIKMYNSVLEFLSSNQEVLPDSCWNNMGVEELNSEVKSLIHALADEVQLEHTAVENNEVLKEKLCRGAADLQVLLHDAQPVIQYSAKISETIRLSLLEKSDSYLKESFTSVQREGLARVGELSKFGISSAVLEEFKKLADEFPKNLRNGRAKKLKRRHIKNLAIKIDSALEHADGAVRMLGGNYLIFVRSYKKARIIRD